MRQFIGIIPISKSLKHGKQKYHCLLVGVRLSSSGVSTTHDKRTEGKRRNKY